MELLDPNIKKFQEEETLKKLLIFQEMELFSPPQENLEKIYFRKWKPLKTILNFLKRKLFLYFWKRKPQQNLLYFRKRNFF